jgi:hypothetical protein
MDHGSTLLLMGLVETLDSVIWAKHVHGDDALRRLILDAPSGTVIALQFPDFGATGSFVKMNDGPHAPTPGIRPVGQSAKKLWREIQARSNGAAVQVSLVAEQVLQPVPATADHKLKSAVAPTPLTALVEREGIYFAGQQFDAMLCVSRILTRQKKSWVDSGSGSLPSE